MKFLDLFAGIGGFRLGMERAGHECVGFCEIDSFARQSYKSIHCTDGEVEMHDITTVSDEFIRGIGHTDIICGGFPCQAFSIAGKRRGFSDTRGTLFFEIMRFASILRPQYLFLENVKGLLNHENGDTFETILRTLDECGYDAEWQVCNSKYFGVAQNRERVFIVGHLRGSRASKIFPFRRESKSTDKQIIVIGKIEPNFNQSGCVYDIEGICPTLRTMQGGNLEPKIAVVANDFKIRKVTPLECWRLQGFPDEAFLAAKFGSREIAREILSNNLDHYSCKFEQKMSDSQLYKQAGNSVTVNVIEEIAKRL